MNCGNSWWNDFSFLDFGGVTSNSIHRNPRHPNTADWIINHLCSDLPPAYANPMSTATPPCIPEFSALSLDSTAAPSSQAAYARERWAREPITLLKRDVYSRFVIFDGRREVCLQITALCLLLTHFNSLTSNPTLSNSHRNTQEGILNLTSLSKLVGVNTLQKAT